MSKPILYLDIDGVLNRWPTNQNAPAKHAAEFFQWAMEVFEIRWLTYWCPEGVMNKGQNWALSNMLGVSMEELEKIGNLKSHQGHKPDAINWVEHEEGRVWFWVDDMKYEPWMQDLRFRQAEDHFIQALSYIDDEALPKTKEYLLEKINVK